MWSHQSQAFVTFRDVLTEGDLTMARRDESPTSGQSDTTRGAWPQKRAATAGTLGTELCLVGASCRAVRKERRGTRRTEVRRLLGRRR